MEKAYGVITGILNNGYANVKIDRKSMCGESCAACGGLCGLHDSVVRAKNTVHAQNGDRVTVTVPTGQGVKALFITYGAPLVYMLVMAVLMSICIPEKTGTVLLLGGVVFWFVLLWILEKKGLFSKRFQAEIIHIQEEKREEN